MKKTFNLIVLSLLLLLLNLAQAVRPSIQYVYSPSGHLLEEQMPNGNVIHHDYDGLGRKTESRDQHGLLGKWTYDAMGRVLSEQDGEGRITRYQYDALGRRTTTHDSVGQLIHQVLAYDGHGNILQEKDGRGSITQYKYDHRHHLIERSKDGITEKYGYDLSGNLAYEIDAEGRTTHYEYNAANQLVKRINPAGKVQQWDYTYGANQQIITTTDEAGLQRVQIKDGRGRLAAETLKNTGNGDEITLYTYDAANNQTQIRYPSGQHIDYTYDSHNRLTAVSTAAGSAAIGYDIAGNPVYRTDGAGRRTLYHYDARHQRIGVVYADGVAETAAYDRSGRLTEATDGNGVKTQISYDVRGREQLRQSGSQKLQFAYDNNNNVTERIRTLAGVSQTETRAYDSHNRLTQRVDLNGETIVTAYHNDGQLARVTGKGGETLYRYNAQGLLDQMSHGASRISLSYRANGQPETTRYADGSTTTTGYDGAGRIISMITRNSAQTLLEQADYRYDINGNRSSEQVVQGPRSSHSSFAYDADHRLVTADVRVSINGTETSNTRTRYQYDAAGNRISEEVSGSESRTRSYSHNQRNQLRTLDDQGVITTFYYDKAGHLRQKQTEQDSRIFHWNATGDLIQVAHNDRSIADYAYDADGLRIQKLSRREARQSSWLGDQAIIDTDLDHRLQARYVFGAQGRSALLRTDATGEVENLHSDGMGSISTVTQEGVAVSYSQFAAFGQAAQQGSSQNKFGFTGHETDTETGLIYAKARYYDADLGRFISRDAFEGHGNLAASWHAYQYAYNNPYRWIDPSGNFTTGVESEARQSLRKKYETDYLSEEDAFQLVDIEHKDQYSDY